MHNIFSIIKKPRAVFRFSEGFSHSVDLSDAQTRQEEMHGENLEKQKPADGTEVDGKNGPEKKDPNTVAKEMAEFANKRAAIEAQERTKDPPPDFKNPAISTLAFGDFSPESPESQGTQAAGVEGVNQNTLHA